MKRLGERMKLFIFSHIQRCLTHPFLAIHSKVLQMEGSHAAFLILSHTMKDFRNHAACLQTIVTQGNRHTVRFFQELIKCINRTNENYTVLKSEFLKSEYWGYCSDECNGEIPGPDSEYNIAKDTDVFKAAWSEGLYDLRKYEPGYCFTYDPPNKSKNGINNGLYILLGHEKLIQPFTYDTIYKRDSSYITHSFEIYLHDKVCSKNKSVDLD